LPEDAIGVVEVRGARALGRRIGDSTSIRPYASTSTTRAATKLLGHLPALHPKPERSLVIASGPGRPRLSGIRGACVDCVDLSLAVFAAASQLAAANGDGLAIRRHA
jgi:hypothetical protein